MSFRNISAWSIRNPVPSIVLFIMLTVAGLVSFRTMQVNDQPDIDFPVVIVTVSQPGAAPSELETQVTQRVEAAVRSLRGIDEITSTATEGQSTTVVQLAIGTPIDRAVEDVRSALQQIRADLPEGILEPQVQRVDSTADDLASYAAVATDMTVEQLSWYIDNTVTKELLSVPGMANVDRNGGVSREIRVILDPLKLQAQGLTASAVNQQLRQVNLNAAGGRAQIAGSEQSLRVLGNAKDAYSLGQTQIFVGNGRTVRLSDIAQVEDLYAEQRSASALDGRQVISFDFQRAKGGSDVTVFAQAQAKLAALEKRNPKVRFQLIHDSVTRTKQNYNAAVEAMVEGAVLAVLIVYLFLRDFRSTVISALAIPLSAIPTFWFMDLMGFTLNQLTLLALSLVAGVLVDDAIVEIENIVRHMRMGKTAYQAAIDAADEIGLAVLATTMAIVAVFLPVSVMPGISGQFFKNFGLTVVVSVLISLAVARLVTPMIAAYFLKAHGQAKHGEGWLMDRYLRTLHWTLDTRRAGAFRARTKAVRTRFRQLLIPVIVAALLFLAVLTSMLRAPNGSIAFALIGGGLAAGFGFVIALVLTIVIGFGAGRARGFDDAGYTGWSRSTARRAWAYALDHRFWVIGIGALAFLLTLAIGFTSPMQFQPESSNDSSTASVEMVPGTTLAQTKATVSRVAELLERQPQVDHVYQRAGVGNGRVTAMFKPKNQRTMASPEFERALTPQLTAIPDARVTFRQQGGWGDSGLPVTITLGGDDPKLLAATADKLLEEMQGLRTVVAPRILGDLERPELVIRPRLDLAANLGVTTSALSSAIRIATLGDIDQNSAKFSLSDRQVPIRVALAQSSRQRLDTINNLPVATQAGGSVPLSLVADISLGSGPTRIQRVAQKRQLTIGAAMPPGIVSSQVMDDIHRLPAMRNLPEGVSELQLGMAKWQTEMVTNFMVAVFAGVFLVFAVLVLLYRRVLAPFVNMGSLLLAPLGGLLLLRLFGMPLSMPVFIGLLMLLGIVAKNSILLIDFALEEMAKGVPIFEAIVDAGHKRAQPIVMTTVAMVAGMLPTAISLTGDSSFRAPMAVTVIGGLLLSTVLTLLIVPATFSLAAGIERWAGPRLGRRLLTYRPGDDGTPAIDHEPVRPIGYGGGAGSVPAE